VIHERLGVGGEEAPIARVIRHGPELHRLGKRRQLDVVEGRAQHVEEVADWPVPGAGDEGDGTPTALGAPGPEDARLVIRMPCRDLEQPRLVMGEDRGPHALPPPCRIDVTTSPVLALALGHLHPVDPAVADHLPAHLGHHDIAGRLVVVAPAQQPIAEARFAGSLIDPVRLVGGVADPHELGQVRRSMRSQGDLQLGAHQVASIGFR
jgi:hypothetical protein